MDMRDFQNALLMGDFDEHLDYVLSAVQERKKSLAPKIWEFRAGDRVRIKGANPKYLNGELATITKVNRSKVVINLDKPAGRFHYNVTTPLSMIEKI